MLQTIQAYRKKGMTIDAKTINDHRCLNFVGMALKELQFLVVESAEKQFYRDTGHHAVRSDQFFGTYLTNLNINPFLKTVGGKDGPHMYFIWKDDSQDWDYTLPLTD